MVKRIWAVIMLSLAAALPAAAQQNNPSFNLVNRSNNTINEVYATSAGMTNWGQDRLGNNSIPPGQSYPIRLPANGECIYDVKVVYANGQAEERRGMNTCNVDNVTFPSGRPSQQAQQGQSTNDPSFRLVNRGRSEINEVYVTATGVDNWGRDRLGDDTVGTGATRVIRLPQGQCIYDVRVVFANREAVEKRRLNLCTITNLSVP